MYICWKISQNFNCPSWINTFFFLWIHMFWFYAPRVVIELITLCEKSVWTTKTFRNTKRKRREQHARWPSKHVNTKHTYSAAYQGNYSTCPRYRQPDQRRDSGSARPRVPASLWKVFVTDFRNPRGTSKDENFLRGPSRESAEYVVLKGDFILSLFSLVLRASGLTRKHQRRRRENV